jgi:protein-disulfide isomerase
MLPFIISSLAGAILGASVVTISGTPLGKDLSARSQHSHILAQVEHRAITLREVEQAAALPLYQLDQQRTHLLQQTVQHLINEELLKTEAGKRGITVAELLSDASQSATVARLASLPAPVKLIRPDTTHDKSEDVTLRDPQEEARIRQALLVSLRRQEDIRLTLPVAEPPVLAVDTDDDPSVGPADAPITIVEFSDFQCPYCQKSGATLKEVRRLYGDKIRVVYRDYPGPNHPQAAPAAEAAQCAGDQGTFWEYHDALFNHQATGTGWDFESLARELGLQVGEFSTCLNTGRYREEVRKDLQDGLALGITSTPTFFINGRPLVGAQPLAEFSRLIDPLLSKPHQ